MMESLNSVFGHLKSYIVDLNDYEGNRGIGRGVSCDVFLKTNKKDKKKYAVKIFKEGCTSGKGVSMFYREVMLLVKCQYMFIIPFKGFSVENKISIVTKYMPNGSLYHVLHNGTINLTGTQKTKIAMGISYGMMHIHKYNILHRDLKSLNILMDENMYPYICDFGLSRYDDTRKSTGIGTPHWMAPELMDNECYTNKVDVYAYGIILWEILTRILPYQSLDKIQILKNVKERKARPPINLAETPEPLVNLMQCCWEDNYEGRPSFQNIFKLFAEKRVYYKGTDLNEIDNFLKEIEEYEKTNSSSRKLFFPEFELKTLEQQNLDLSFIKEGYNKPSFMVKIKNVLKNIKRKDYDNLLTELSNVISNLSDGVMNSLLSCFCDSFKKNRVLFHSFVDSELIQKLPYSNQNAFQQLHPIILDSLNISTTSIPFEKIKQVFNFFDSYPVEIFQIFQIYSNDLIDDFVSYFLSEFNNTYSQYMLTPISLKILLQIIQKKDLISEEYKQIYKNILKNVMDQNDVEILQYGYKIISFLFFEDLIPNNIIEHIKIKELFQDVLAVINLSNNLLNNQDLIPIIIDNLNYKNAFLFLIKMANIYENAKIILNSSEKWINRKEIPSSFLLILIETITKHENIVFTEKQIIDLCNLFNKELTSRSPKYAVITLICQLIKLNENIIEQFTKTNFLLNFIQSAIKNNSQSSIHSLLVLLTDISRITYHDCFIEIVKQLPTIINIFPNYFNITVEFLENLISYPNMKKIIEDSEIKTMILKDLNASEIKLSFQF